jgi:hypothetical protein
MDASSAGLVARGHGAGGPAVSALVSRRLKLAGCALNPEPLAEKLEQLFLF